MAEIWEKQPTDTPREYEAFVVYRDLGVDRSQEKVAKALGKSRQLIGRWSAEHNWLERALAYDRYLEARDRILSTEAAREEHREKLNRYREQMEQLGNAMLATAAEMLKKVHTRARTLDSEEMKPSDLANLTRSLSAAAEMGSRLTAESLGVTKLLEEIMEERRR